MTELRGTRSTRSLALAEETMHRLQEALALHGITLPSLWTERIQDGRYLLELGRINTETARHLAEALEKTAGDVRS